MKPPAVSVLTTVYNGERYLRETIDSVLGQTFTDLEHVVVDDGSTDRTSEILVGIEDERLRVVQLPRSGRGAALNAGLSECRGDLIAVLDADDVAFPARLALQSELMALHPGVDVLGGACAVHQTAPPSMVPGTFPPVRTISPREFIKRTPIAHSAVMMRKASLERIGGYDTGRQALFDYDLWIRMAVAGFSIARTDAIVVYKRIHRAQSFERRKRLRYLVATLRERRRAARLFGERPVDRLYPFVGFAYGLIPTKIRMAVFRLSGE